MTARTIVSVQPSVVELCSELVRINTSNYGTGGCEGESAAAEFIVALLRDVGFEPLLLESAPTRANVVLRVPGTSPQLPAVLVHGHLDVVPAEAEHWSVPPFEGRVADGYLWGRGAKDMKHMIATMLSTLLAWGRSGFRPRRDTVFAFVADEEQDGEWGAEWLVDHHPELFDGVVAGISETGGEPIDVVAPDGSPRRFYPVAVAEKGSLHMSVTASGTPGHGSLPNDDNPVAHLVTGLSKVAEYRWPLELTPTVLEFLRRATGALGIPLDVDALTMLEETEAADLLDEACAQLGNLRGLVDMALRCSSTVTVLDAGSKMNVIPATARAEIDVRSLPGRDDEMLQTIDALLGPSVTRTMLSNSRAIASPIDSEWFDAISACVEASDPGAVVLPYCMAGGTDAKPYSRLGIAGYGFAPLAPDPDGRTAAGVHGVDERVPVASLIGGAAMLASLLESL